MGAETGQVLNHPLLARAGVEHGFGTRDSAVSGSAVLARPRQVHGAVVAIADAAGGVHPEVADAVVSREHGVAAAILTADCVPILACTEDGRSVAAIHAGWRGLVEGVIGAGLAALKMSAEFRSGPADLWAVVGPHIGPCCYEVDDVVLEPLRARFSRELAGATRSTRSGHALLDLGVLVQAELARAGVASAKRALIRDVCTRCDALRFHSVRRDGASAGRMLHYVVPRDGAGG